MNTKKEIIKEMARIWLSLSRIGALMELQGAKCGKCGKCGHQARTETEDYGVLRSGTENAGTNGKGRDPREAKPERLPDVPDWRDTEAGKRELSGKTGNTGNTKITENRGNRSRDARSAGVDGAARLAADDRLTRIRLTVAMHEGESLAEIIRAIKEDGTEPKELAGLLGVNQARISEALHGKARPGFVARFCEVLGEGADLAKGRTGRTGRTNAGTEAAARDQRSGKRGAK